MSFLLRSVELSNIRSHDHVVFKPSEQGVTSILGKNGAGKSSIVDSIAWCLFGTKIGGVKNSSIMKSGVPYKKGDFYARVIIEVDGQELLVERKFVTKGGAVEASVYGIEDEYYENLEKTTEVVLDTNAEAVADEIETEEDEESSNSGKTTPGLVHLAGPAVSHSENYVRQRLKMDEKGFLSSILVQQKEVDQLISASARERAKVIEDLTGITSITNALDDARKEYNALKKASTYSHADEDGIKEGEERVLGIIRQVDVKKQEFVDFKDRLSVLKTQGKELNEKLKRGKEIVSHRRKIESRIAIVENNYTNKSVERDELIEERNERKAELGDNTSAENAKRTIAERDKVQKEYGTAQARVETLLAEIDSIKKEIISQRKVLENTSLDTDDQKVLSANEKKAQKDLKGMNESRKVLEEETKVLNEKNVSLVQANKSFSSAIEVLSKDDGECPTCLQKVSDAKAAIEGLEESINRNVSLMEENTSEINSKKEKVEELNSETSKLEQQLTSVKTIAELTLSLRSKSDEFEVARGIERDHEGNLKSLSKHADNASSIVYKLEEYQRVLEKAQRSSKEVKTLELELNDLKDEFKNTRNISEATLEKAEEQLNKRRKQHQDMSTNATRIEGEIATLQERKRSEENMLAKLREDFDKHKKLMENLSIASSTVKITEEFRKDRIDNSIPVIENYASDFIARFTDNKFVKLSMDNKFNASVMLSDGELRAVSALSGGELSATAIALRLAISMLLGGGGDKSSMILDEVLVSMSTDRAENILYTIKDMAQGQVIMISHSDVTTEISDYVFDLDSLEK